MRVLVFNTKSYDRRFLLEANARHGHQLEFLEPRLNRETVSLVRDAPVVCVFVNDCLDGDVLASLKARGVELVALRCAGFNNVDLEAAQALGLRVVRVPAYSPEAVAEHTLGLILSLNRKIHRAYNRVREGNFSLEGLLGFNLSGRTVGIIGTGRIGTAVARIFKGCGMRLLGHDPQPNEACRGLGLRYVGLDTLYRESDIVTLHCPLTPDTLHLIDGKAIEQMRPGVMLINTSRGAVLDTDAVVAALKARRLGHLGLDVYEQEADLFFQDLSGTIIDDDLFERLMTFPNVLVTAHQGFFTEEALSSIAETTLESVSRYQTGDTLPNEVARGR